MTEYNKYSQKYYDDLEKNGILREKFFFKENEKNSLVSKNLDNDDSLRKFYEYKNTFKPRIIPKDPKTFCFFSSAEMRYNNASYNIINYYPFDGTQQETLDWYTSSAPLEVAIVEKHWPSSVGHLKFNNNQYINFFGGPQKIQGSEYVGNLQKGESALKIDPDKGNTAEFWLKKTDWKADFPYEETLFEVGSHPSHVAEAPASFRVYLTNIPTDTSPFIVDYKSGSHGLNGMQIGEGVTKASVADGKWHHYAFRAYQSGSNVYVDMFVDGKKNDTKSVSPGTPLGAQDSYMAGTIGAKINSSEGSLTGSLDEFRFWKGQRTNRQLNRYFDQKVFASDLEEDDYVSRLGVYYKFNKTILNDNILDSHVMDYSGNDLIGKITNYTSSTRESTSAIDQSSVSSNKETPDLSLLEQDSRVFTLIDELIKIAKSYDKNNHNSIMKMIPSWANDPYGIKEKNEKSDFYILLNMLAEEFDEIKLNIDSIKFLINKNFDSNHTSLGQSEQNMEEVTNPDQSGFFSCSDSIKDLDIWPGNRIDFPRKNLEKLGFQVDSLPLELNINPEDDFENIVGNVKLTMHPIDVKRLILDNVLIAANSILKKKGNEKSFDQLMSCWGIDRNLVSYNVYGQNSEIDLSSEYKSVKVTKFNSFDFSKASGSVLYMSADNSQPEKLLEEETNYIYSVPVSGENSDPLPESHMTFEGNFIFPRKNRDDDHPLRTSIFGVRAIDKTEPKFVINSPDAGKIQVNVAKLSALSKNAKFELTCSAGSVESPFIKEVYDNSRWNLSVRISRSGSADARFLTASNPDPQYHMIFSGHNYIADNLQNHFKKTISITHDQYQEFIRSDKTVFIGAELENVTGSTVRKADFKFLNMKAWNQALPDTDLKELSQNINGWGLLDSYRYATGYTDNSNNSMSHRSLIFKIDTPAISKVPTNGIIEIFDFASGSVSNTNSFGKIVGSKYPFKTTQLDSSIFSTSLSTEYINIAKPQIPELVKTSEEVKVKKTELDKFKVNVFDESKIISFEKSFYRQISEDMINFLSNMSPMNNLIGEPVNKYRQDYKLLSHLRQRFFENVENDNQFERFVEYYRWIDYSLGRMLEQLVPALAQHNTGIENVIESHVLERNKYNHKMPILKTLYGTGAEIEGRAQNTSIQEAWSRMAPEIAEEQDQNQNATRTRIRTSGTSGNNKTNGRDNDDVKAIRLGS